MFYAYKTQLYIDIIRRDRLMNSKTARQVHKIIGSMLIIITAQAMLPAFSAHAKKPARKSANIPMTATRYSWLMVVGDRLSNTRKPMPICHVIPTRKMARWKWPLRR